MSVEAKERVRLNLLIGKTLVSRARAQAREQGVSLPEFARLALVRACEAGEAVTARRRRAARAEAKDAE